MSQFRIILEYFIDLDYQILLIFTGFLATIIYLTAKTVFHPKPESSNWAEVGKIRKLIIHPLKSCQGVEVEEAVVARAGLRSSSETVLRDRVFAIMHLENDVWVYQDSEKLPYMTAIKTAITGNCVELALLGNKIKFEVPEDNEENRRSCKFHSEKIKVLLDCGDTVAHWLEQNLEKSGLRLFYHHLEHTQRELMSPLQRRFGLGPEVKGTLQHDTSYMIMTKSSIDHLNTKLKKLTTWHSFRPTILIESETKLGPFCEDKWKLVKIGNHEKQHVILEYSLPCSRCGQINIDQEVGKMSVDKEPLQTLFTISHPVNSDKRIEKYMMNKAIMGAHMGIYKDYCDQIIRVGDPVYAISRQ